MALTRDQVGLIFRIDADAKPAINEMEKLKTSVDKSAKNTQAIIRESFETLSSEIIESFGIDGDIANSIANQLVVVKNAAFIIGAAVTGVTVALGVGLILAANKAAELGDKIDELRQKTGLAAETLSGLNLAAREEGKTLDDVSSALIAFNKNLTDAQRGSKELQGVFKQLGVDFRGNTDAALRQVIERIAGMRDGALKAAAAQKVFGDSGADLIPILNRMEGGIDGAIKKAKELGLFFNNEAIAATQEYKENIRELGIEFDGLATRIGNSVIPALTKVLGLINQGAKAARGTEEDSETFALRLRAFIFGGPKPEAPSGIPETPLPDFKPTPIGTKTKKEFEDRSLEFAAKAAKEAEETAKRLEKERLERANTLSKLLEEAEKEHKQNLERIARESAERQITQIQAEAEQRIITELEAAERIGAIRIAAFAGREDELKTELERTREVLRSITEQITAGDTSEKFTALRAQLLTEEQAFVDELELLQKRRARAEEEAVNAVIEARRRDIESLIQLSEEQRRVRGEQLERQGFSPAVADAIAGMELLLGRTLTLWERNQIAAREYARTLEEDVTAALTRITDVQTLFKDAFGASIDAFINSAGSLKSAVQALKAALISPFIEAARTLAKFYAAKSIAAFAEFDFRGGALYALASAGFAVLGALGTAAIGGGGGRATAPSSSFGGGASQQQQGRRIIEQGDRQRPEPQVIILRAEYQPGIIIQEMTRDYRNNGPSRQVLRRDILGEQPT